MMLHHKLVLYKTPYRQGADVEWRCEKCRFNFFLPDGYISRKGHPVIGAHLAHIDEWEYKIHKEFSYEAGPQA